jgi:hypothetical protein
MAVASDADKIPLAIHDTLEIDDFPLRGVEQIRVVTPHIHDDVLVHADILPRLRVGHSVYIQLRVQRKRVQVVATSANGARAARTVTDRIQSVKYRVAVDEVAQHLLELRGRVRRLDAVLLRPGDVLALSQQVDHQRCGICFGPRQQLAAFANRRFAGWIVSQIHAGFPHYLEQVSCGGHVIILSWYGAQLGGWTSSPVWTDPICGIFLCCPSKN